MKRLRGQLSSDEILGFEMSTQRDGEREKEGKIRKRQI